ncbi:MAG: DinB family protein [Candidatus Eisenbacteria bacterium]
MFQKISDFHTTYEHFTSGTLKLLEALDNACLSCSAAPGHRTLGQVAWHIVTTIPEMMSKTGLPLSAIPHDAPPPAKATEIVSAYRKVSGELARAVKENWTDASLQVADDLYGEKWLRGMTLRILLDHEIHHRGQMTVLMRHAGVAVPGIYGPAKEDWVKMGMQPPQF